MQLTATIVLRDKFTATLNKAYKSTKQLTQAFEETSNNLKKLGATVVSPVVRVKDLATKTIGAVTTRVRQLGRMIAAPTIRVIDRASSVIGAIYSRLTSLKTLAGGIILGIGAQRAWAATVGAGMELERQQVSMRHFIGVQRKGASPETIAREADQYLAWLREYANLTPFLTSEVIAAGTRAINVAQGNIQLAQELVKLAGDMAALTPGKTLEDAMEALADLKTGETERLKEFGFRITAEDIVAAAGLSKGKLSDLSEADFMRAYSNIVSKQLQPFFAGGAEKLSKTGAGLWSTILGNIGTALQNIGRQALELLKPQLERIVNAMTPEAIQRFTEVGSRALSGFLNVLIQIANWIWQNWPRVEAVLRGISNYYQQGLEFWRSSLEMLKPLLVEIFTWLQPKLVWLGQTLISLWSIIQTAMPLIASIMQTAWKVIGPILDSIYNSIRIIWELFKLAWPSIVSILQWAWSIIKPILEGLSWGLNLVAKGLGWVASKLGAVSGGTTGGGNVAAPAQHATGIAYVPYDNYPALLHRGERVLTAAENRQYSRRGQGNIIINIQKLADRIDASNPADVDRLLEKLEERLVTVAANMGAA